ncbi:hypothetical protein JB92DRAFT_3128731 [Gautieria morchelliformis]|nr:hypothetical protein JB92DRAFT_3128731 [Gautieria morchelliformis]
MSSPPSVEASNPQDSWGIDPANDESSMVHMNDTHESAVAQNGDAGAAASELEDPGPLLPSKIAGGPDLGVPGAKPGTIYREKQIKPNKVYVGGLPEHTREEDLQSCFGKIGQIASIELKLGFGFVEFVDRDAAQESVAKYHEGYFMGNKIRVELSHGGGRTAKFPGEPGACFKCGQMGHWARECPNHVVTIGHRKPEATLLDRVSHPPRDFPAPAPPPPPPRGYSPYRDDYRAPPVRDARFGYDYPTLPPRDTRDYRSRDIRPISPPRDYRDFPTPRSSRDVEDYRRDFRGPPPPRYDSRPGYYPDVDYPARPGYVPPPPLRDIYDARGGYDKRMGLAPPNDRYPVYPPPVGGGRSRTPPRVRDDYDKAMPPRDYPPVPDYRGRHVTPPPGARYPDTGRSGPGPMDGPGGARYRRRSQSPVARPGPPYPSGPQPPVGYSGGPPYPPSSGNFASGYPAPGSAQGRPPSGGGGPRERDYPPRLGRDSGDPGSYARRP